MHAQSESTEISEAEQLFVRCKWSMRNALVFIAYALFTANKQLFGLGDFRSLRLRKCSACEVEVGTYPIGELSQQDTGMDGSTCALVNSP